MRKPCFGKGLFKSVKVWQTLAKAVWSKSGKVCCNSVELCCFLTNHGRCRLLAARVRGKRRVLRAIRAGSVCEWGAPVRLRESPAAARARAHHPAAGRGPEGAASCTPMPPSAPCHALKHRGGTRALYENTPRALREGARRAPSNTGGNLHRRRRRRARARPREAAPPTLPGPGR